MIAKKSQTLLFVVFGVLLLVLLGAVVFLFSQQQRLQEEISQGPETQQRTLVPAPISPTAHSGPTYGDIGFRGELREGSTFVFVEWNAEDQIRKVELFDSGDPTGGTVLFKIVSSEASLPKPYTLGTIPDGFKLVSGKVFSRLEPGKYRVEITALQTGREIMVLAYVTVSGQ